MNEYFAFMAVGIILYGCFMFSGPEGAELIRIIKRKLRKG